MVLTMAESSYSSCPGPTWPRTNDNVVSEQFDNTCVDWDDCFSTTGDSTHQKSSCSSKMWPVCMQAVFSFSKLESQCKRHILQRKLRLHDCKQKSSAERYRGCRMHTSRPHEIPGLVLDTVLRPSTVFLHRPSKERRARNQQTRRLLLILLLLICLCSRINGAPHAMARGSEQRQERGNSRQDSARLLSRDEEPTKILSTVSLVTNKFHQGVYDGTTEFDNFWADQGLLRTQLRFSVMAKPEGLDEACKRRSKRKRAVKENLPLLRLFKNRYSADKKSLKWLDLLRRTVEDVRGPVDILLEKQHVEEKKKTDEDDPIEATEGLHSDLSNNDSGRIDHDWDVYVAPVENVLADNEFLIRVGVGTPQQIFWTAVDSGSSDTWVFSGACCFQSNHSTFDPKLSSTFANRTLDWNGTAVMADNGTKGQLLDISYGEASTLDTFLAFDTVTINTGKEALAVKNQTISLVVGTHGVARQSRKNEALLGIGPSASSAAPGSILTPFEQLCRHDRLHKPMLSVTFVKANRFSAESNAGRLTLGGIDQDSLAGDITWINSTAQTFWGGSFIPGAMRFGTIDIWDPEEKARRFIVDTGSTLLFMPEYTTNFTNKMITGSYYEPESKRWLVPCRTGIEAYEATLKPEEKTPAFSFDAGDGHRILVPPQDLVTFPTKPYNATVTGGREDLCMSSVQLGTDRFAVLGNTFIKNAVIVFDYGDSSLQKRRIGFGNRKDAGNDGVPGPH